MIYLCRLLGACYARTAAPRATENTICVHKCPSGASSRHPSSALGRSVQLVFRREYDNSRKVSEVAPTWRMNIASRRIERLASHAAPHRRVADSTSPLVRSMASSAGGGAGGSAAGSGGDVGVVNGMALDDLLVSRVAPSTAHVVPSQ